MSSNIRTRWIVLAAVTVGGCAVLGGAALAAVGALNGNSDPDPQADGTVAVCSDVRVHAWYTVNIGTEAKPDNRKDDDELDVTGHGRDPFDADGRRRCVMIGPAFGSRVRFTAPGLNGGRPAEVTAPTDRVRALVVRFTRNPDGTVGMTQGRARVRA
jgi:hypothetical protein